MIFQRKACFVLGAVCVSAFAHDHSSTKSEADKSWFAVSSEDQVNKAPCARSAPLSSEEMMNWFSRNTSRKIQDEAERVIGLNDGGFALKALYSKHRYGFEVSTQWDAFPVAQLDSFLLALSDFPPQTFDYVRQKSADGKGAYVRRTPGKSNDGVLADTSWDTIRFFDRWVAEPASLRRSSAMHELAHFFGGGGSAAAWLDNSKGWQNLSGWKPTYSVNGAGKQVMEWSNNRSAIPSRYGEKSPKEDFAESVVAYRYDAENFRRRNPKKYRFLKETVFDGLEYDTSAHCQPDQAYSIRALKKIAASKVAVPRTSLPKTFNFGLSKACRRAVQMDYKSDRCAPGNDFWSCVRKRLAPQAVSNAMSGDGSWYGLTRAQITAGNNSAEIERVIQDASVTDACRNYFASENNSVAEWLAGAEKAFLGRKKNLDALGAAANLKLNPSQYCKDLINEIPSADWERLNNGYAYFNLLREACVQTHSKRRQAASKEDILAFLQNH